MNIFNNKPAFCDIYLKIIYMYTVYSMYVQVTLVSNILKLKVSGKPKDTS